MTEVVIRVVHDQGDGYWVEMYRREGAVLTSMAPRGGMQVTDAERSAWSELLPGNTPAAGLQAPGKALYGRLRGALGQPLDDVVNGPSARIYLDLGPTDLHRLPWEIMRWSKPGISGSTEADVSQAHHLCRVFEPDWTASRAGAKGPLRVLLAIGAAPDDPAVEAKQEEDEIRRRVQPAQRTVDIDVVRPANRKALYDAIRRFVPHVLHFIGHGTSNPAQVKFRRPAPAEGEWSWTGSDVTADVGNFNLDNWKPGLVFLNACRTGTAAGQMAPMAGAFLANGTKATIAMQGNIRGVAAGVLAGVFYEKLAAGVEINEALSMARGIVAQEHGAKEAALAALTMRCAPAATLPSFPGLADDYAQRMRECKLLPQLTVFVNQSESRRALCDNLWPPREADPLHRFLLLRGDAGFGKTALSAWMLDLGLRLGYRVRYVSIKSQADVDYVKILKRIWGDAAPGPTSPLTDPLPPLGADLAALLDTSRDMDVYPKFRQALADAARERTVAIVLDEFDKTFPPGVFWLLWEHLFVPVARRELKNVIVVVVLGDDEYLEYKVDQELKARPQFNVPRKEIRLRALDPEEFKVAFGEYVHFRSVKFRSDEVRTILGQLTPIFIRNESRPLSVERFEEKAQEVARVMSLAIEKIEEIG